MCSGFCHGGKADAGLLTALRMRKMRGAVAHFGLILLWHDFSPYTYLYVLCKSENSRAAFGASSDGVQRAARLQYMCLEDLATRITRYRIQPHENCRGGDGCENHLNARES